MEIKAGDTVHVRAVVTRIDKSQRYFAGRDGEGDERGFFCLSDILHVERSALQIGDSVRRGSAASDMGQILAIDPRNVWAMVFFHSHPVCVALKDLVRA